MQRVVRGGSSRSPFVAVQLLVFRRCIHCSFPRYAITNLEMPAMSPTMTEGGISQWKKKEGEAFSAGDVLLEIETDKATIDVEAQDDGVLGKILFPEGSKNLPVGRIIALLAEEGDDISNLQPPVEEPKSAKQPESSKPPSKPTKDPSPPSPKSHSDKHIYHSRPLFPSVLRLLQANDVENPEKIKGTGVRGMLTKGDVLAHLGLASSPNGTYKEPKKDVGKVPPNKEEVKPLDGLSVRRIIVSSLLNSSIRARAAAAPKVVADFDSIITDYIPSTRSEPSIEKLPSSQKDLDNDFDRLITPN